MPEIEFDFVEDPGGTIDEAGFEADIFEAGGEELDPDVAKQMEGQFKLAGDSGELGKVDFQAGEFTVDGEPMSGEKFEDKVKDNIENSEDPAKDTAKDIAETIGLDFDSLDADSQSTLKENAQNLIENKIKPAMDVDAKTEAGNKVTEKVGDPGEGVSSDTFAKDAEGNIKMEDGEPVKAEGADETEFEKEKEKYKEGQEKLDKAMKENEEIKEKMEKLKEKIEERAKEGKESKVGDWVKYAAFGLAGLSLFDAIHQHQNAMNGCWQVDSSGNKIKIGNLTCDKDAANTNAASSLPNCPIPLACQDGSKNTSTCYVPCESGKTCSATTGNNIATVVLPPSPSVPPSVSPSKASACGTFLQPCASTASGGGCHPMCSAKKIPVPKGTSLQCVNTNFWGAAMDLAEHPWELTDGIISNLKKYLVWILIGLVVIIGLKWAWNKIMTPSSTVRIESAPVAAPVEAPVAAYRFRYPYNFPHGNFK